MNSKPQLQSERGKVHTLQKLSSSTIHNAVPASNMHQSRYEILKSEKSLLGSNGKLR
jgi:hypothetical protein